MANRIDININYGTQGSDKSSNKVLTDLNAINASTDNLIKKQRLLRKALRELAVNPNASKEAKAIARELDLVNKQVNKFNKSAGVTGNTWSKALGSFQFKFNALGNIMASVTASAVRMLGQLGKSVITISKDFEESMSGVRAITMATDDEFNKLRMDAIRLGGETIYTAVQISKLQEALGKLGFTIPEIRAATDGVVALAQATGEDLAQSANISGIMIRAFGLNASELTRIVDVMAKSFNTSALDLEKFRETMKFVAPVAKAAGYTIEETTTIMAKLADIGVSGSLAGTSLRNMMLRLTDANSKLSKAFGFTAKSLPDLIMGLTMLRDRGIDATKALELTDRRSVTAFLGLIEKVPELWDMYNALVASAGEAEKMGEMRMDNFAGSVEKLSGAWDSFVLSINKGNNGLRFFVDIIRGAVEGATNLLTGELDKAQLTGIARANKLRESIRKDEETLRNEAIEGQRKLLDEFDKLEKKSADKVIEYQKRNNDIEKKLEEDIQNLWRKNVEERISTEKNRLELMYSAGWLKNVVPEKLTIDDLINTKDWEDSPLLNALTKTEKKLLGPEMEQLSFVRELIELKKTLEDKSLASDLSELYDEIDEVEKKWMDLDKVQIDAMADGMEKEIALMKYGYKSLLENAEHYGINKNKIYDNINKQVLAIQQKYTDKEFTEEQNRLKILAEISGNEFNIKSTNAMNTAQQRLKWIDENIHDEERRSAEIYNLYLTLQRDLLQIESDMMEDRKRNAEKRWKDFENQIVSRTQSDFYDPFAGQDKEGDDWSFFGKMFNGKLDLTSREMHALSRGVSMLSRYGDQLIDTFRDQVDAFVQASEDRVSALEREVEEEKRLMEEGLANNYSVKQKELAKAKQLNDEAIAEQKRVARISETAEGIIQFANLATASTEIIKSLTKVSGPVGAAIGLGIAATMMSGFYIAKASMRSKYTEQYGEGGEIIGPSHENGGVPIEAEGGEYVIKATQYAKYRDLVQAINEDKLNKQLMESSVSLDDRKYEKMMRKYFDSRNYVQGDGYRIERWGNRTRRIHA